MATYPDDATVDINSFSVVSSNTQTVVTVSATTYTLPSTADTRSEVLVIVNGVTQASTAYTLTDSWYNYYIWYCTGCKFKFNSQGY